MPEILEPPKKSLEAVEKVQTGEDAYWKAVDSFIALEEGAKMGDPKLLNIIERLKGHIFEYDKQAVSYDRFNARERKLRERDSSYQYDLEKGKHLGRIRTVAHNAIIDDVNELYKSFSNQGLDTSWRFAISEEPTLDPEIFNDARAAIIHWTQDIAKYLARKNESRAA